MRYKYVMELLFVLSYFFGVVAVLLAVELVNSIIVLPVFLLWLGPPAEVRAHKLTLLDAKSTIAYSDESDEHYTLL